MEIRVSGHQVNTGEALRTHVDQRLSTIAERYFSRAISAQVTFGKGPHDHAFTCDIIAHVPNGVVLKGTAKASEAHPAFDEAADKIERQLRRYKNRLRDRHGQPVNRMAQAGPDSDAAGYTIFAEVIEEEEVGDHPPVVAETRVDIPEVSVSDAVMQLDLRNTNALLFKNVGTGQFNMVYRRGDGTIGWVEPQRD
jgi:ribosomal subunit interface protein